MDSKSLHELSTFDLFFNMATGKYTEAEKMEILGIIKERQDAGLELIPGGVVKRINKRYKITKEPLPGSKAAKIKKLLDEGKSAPEVYEILKKKKIKIYYPEIYRLMSKAEKPTASK